MAYTQASSGPSGEIQKLQQEITGEVNADAQHISTAVFGKTGAMPDMRRMSDDELNARYRNAYQTQDRQWLTQEAQRDPEQFVTVARRIGVMLPEEFGQSGLPDASPPSLPPSPPPAPPMSAPAPVLPPITAPVAGPPSPGISLGAVAQPAQPVPLTAPPVAQGL
jgi:hypothetical protein